MNNIKYLHSSTRYDALFIWIFIGRLQSCGSHIQIVHQLFNPAASGFIDYCQLIQFDLLLCETKFIEGEKFPTGLPLFLRMFYLVRYSLLKFALFGRLLHGRH